MSDVYLSSIYKKFMGVDFLNIDNDTLILNKVTLLSLLISNNTSIQNNVNVKNDIFSNTLLINNNFTCNNNLSTNRLNLNLTANIYKNINIANIINNNIYVTGFSNINNCIIKDNINILNQLYSNNIYTTNINSLQKIFINGSLINIGNNNTDVIIQGTLSNQNSRDITIMDKLISVNVKTINPLTGNDSGILSGINIVNVNSNGFVRVANNGLNYEIKSPGIEQIGYVTLFDSVNNLKITGNTFINSNTTIRGVLYVSNNSIIQSNLTVSNLSNINIINCNNLTGSNSFTSTFYNINTSNINIKNDLNGKLVSNKNITVLNNLYCTNLISNVSNFYNSQIQALNLVNNITTNTIYNQGILQISSFGLLYNFSTINSRLNINNNLLVKNITILSNMRVTGNSIFTNNVSINNSTTIFNNCWFNNLTIGSIINTINIRNGIIAPLQEFPDNTLATNNGIPEWGFYRTGGIIKIRLPTQLPIILLNGLENEFINVGDMYIDPGVTVIFTETLTPLITSINDGNNELISNFIVSNTSYNLSTILNIYKTGNYTITYSVTDKFKNTNTIQRYVQLNYFNKSDTTFCIYDGTSYIEQTNSAYSILATTTTFTVECWIYLINYSTLIHLISFYNLPYGIIFTINSNGCMGILLYSRNNQITLTNKTIPLNSWVHIVWMRSGNILYTFINGIVNTGVNIDTTLNSYFNETNTINTTRIGNKIQSPSSINGLYGCINQIIVTNTTNYPISGFIPVYDLTKNNQNNILLKTNNIKDTVLNNILNISPNIQLGVRYLTFYDDSYNIGNGSFKLLSGNFTTVFMSDFTFELWLYPYNYNTLYSKIILLDTRDPIYSSLSDLNDYKCALSINSNGYPLVEFLGPVVQSIQIQSKRPIPLNTWSHIVWMRKSNKFYNYINGQMYINQSNDYSAINTSFNTLTNITNISFTPVDQLDISTAFKFQGLINQPLLRNYAVYDINSSFIPQYNLASSIINNTALFYIQNSGYNTISNQNISLSNISIIPRYYANNNNIINHKNNYNYITCYNFNNGWLGKIVNNFNNLLTNDFTIEMWIYITSLSSDYIISLIDFSDPVFYDNSLWLGTLNQTDAEINKFMFGISPLGELAIWTSSTDITINKIVKLSNQRIKLNTWTHIAWVCKNDSYYGFINGSNDFATTYTFTVSNQNTLILGRKANYISATANYQFNGYMSQILIRNGCQYDINTRFIPQFNLTQYVKGNAIFFLNDDYTDMITNISLPKRFNVQLDKRYLLYNISLDTSLGTIGPISYNYNVLSTSNWSIESWIYVTQFNGSYSIIFDFRNSISPATSKTFSLGINNIGRLFINIFGDNIYTFSQYYVNLNEWTHILWAKLNSGLYSCVNGFSNSVIQLPSSINNLLNLNNLCIGGSANEVISNTKIYQFNGYISSIRVSSIPNYNITSHFNPLYKQNTQSTLTDLFLMNDNKDIVSNTILTQNVNVKYVFRPLFVKFSHTYNGLTTLMFNRSNTYNIIDSSNNWTFEGWIYINNITPINKYILSTNDYLNPNQGSKLSLGYYNNTLFYMISTVSGSPTHYYSTTGLYNKGGLKVNTWNHIAFVYTNNNIYYYINGLNHGSNPLAPSSISTTSIIQLNGNPVDINNNIYYINGNYNQLSFLTIAKYFGEFIPDNDLKPSNFANYILFLGDYGKDLVSSYNMTSNNLPFTYYSRIIYN